MRSSLILVFSLGGLMVTQAWVFSAEPSKGDSLPSETRKAGSSVDALRDDLSDWLSRKLPTSGDPRFTEPEHATFPLHGWTVHLNRQLWEKNNREATQRMLELLDGQLQRVVDTVPSQALAELRKIPLWINPLYPGKRGSAEYHPNRKWLVDNDRNPKMARAVEITNVDIFPFENRRMPFLLLHELAHGYHDRVIAGGHGNPEIKEAYERAKASGSYDDVARFDGNQTVRDKAYAMSTPMEYFAENSEAYFGKNDFFPFNRRELKEHDPEMHDLIARLWNHPGKPKESTAPTLSDPAP